jgi:hypothetical protein
VVCATPIVEESVVALGGRRAERDRWVKWYGALLRLVGHADEAR